jgi:small-conductance mechanosensitive channel
MPLACRKRADHIVLTLASQSRHCETVLEKAAAARGVAGSIALSSSLNPARVMPVRVRKFIGAVALFALVTIWALLAMALAQAPLIRDNALASIAYYVIAGMGWVLPAIPIVAWMSRQPRATGSQEPPG